MRDAKRIRILTAARGCFLRYGYKRVSMSDIAEAAGISRAALYLLFKNKEDIFGAVYLQWVEETIADIETEMPAASSPTEKMERAFEIWAVRPFEMVLTSPEAKELIDCSFAFAQEASRQGYDRFERTLVPVLSNIQLRNSATPERAAHVLASSVRGFKQTATTPSELRHLIRDLLMLCL